MSNETVTQEEQIVESVDQIMDQPTDEVAEPQAEISTATISLAKRPDC